MSENYRFDLPKLPSPPPNRRRRASGRSILLAGIVAGLSACLSPNSRICEDEGESCHLLTDDTRSSSSPDATQATAAITPPPGAIVDTTPNSGWTEGNFSVTNDGAAEYDLPLWVPDGRGGLQPKLSLHYSSSSDNGLAGVGWSLQGFSRITPCPRTNAQDGRREAIKFTADDVYCLDGQRLRPVAENRWPTVLEREYRTEMDTFARIVSYTSSQNFPGQLQPQPDSFKVWTKGGEILTFSRGLTARALLGINPEEPTFVQSNGRTIIAWPLRTLDDRNGNVVTFEYNEEEINLNWRAAQITPRRITYGPDRRVELSYESRPDPIDRFQVGLMGGLPTRLGKRLKAIQMFTGNDLLREYRLTYQNNSITARSLLQSIAECDHKGTCLSPLEFDWSLGSYKFDVIDTSITDVGSSFLRGHRFLAGDVNGDGRDDLIYDGLANEWTKRISNGSDGFGNRQGTGIPRVADNHYQPKIRPIDFDRDDRVDLLVEVPSSSHPGKTKYSLYRSTGPAYSEVTPELDDRPVGGADNIVAAYFADLDGNGWPDYVAPVFKHSSGSSWLQWSHRLNFGTAFGPTIVGTDRLPHDPEPLNHNRVTDFDADGRGDLLLPNRFPRRYIRLEYNNGQVSRSTSELNLPIERLSENEDPKNLHFADVNGDGLDDVIYPFDGLTTQLNLGMGFSFIIEGPADYANPTPSTEFGTDRGVRIVDFNNDGNDDVLVFHLGPHSADPGAFDRGTQLYVWRNNGFVRIPLDIPGAIAPLEQKAVQPLDFNGDGALDIARTHLTGFLRLLRRQGGVPDRLLRVRVPALGPRVEIDYTNLADPAVHSPGACVVPLICPRRGGTIVSKHRLANGVDLGSQWHQFVHTYTAARVDPLGRGWLGFETHEIVDEERSATTTMSSAMTPSWTSRRQKGRLMPIPSPACH